MDILQEKLKRYQRLHENDDYKQTISELRELFKIDGSVFLALNTTNPDQYLWAREGIRTFLNKLDLLVIETESAIKYNKTGDDNDE